MVAWEGCGQRRALIYATAHGPFPGKGNPVAGRKVSVDLTTFVAKLADAQRTGHNQSWVARELGVSPAAVTPRIAHLREKGVEIPTLAKGRRAYSADIHDRDTDDWSPIE